MVFTSVIIPAYNEEKDIGDCLSSLENQDYQDFEILVVDDGSTDRTQEIVKKFDRVILVPGEHKGPGFSRNLGAKLAKGEILVFVDADMTFDRRYLNALIMPLQKDISLFGTTHGQEEAMNMDNTWARLWGKERVSPQGEQVIFRAIRKSEFLGKGGFDPELGYADDQTFFLKFGLRPIVVASAICYHRNAESLKEVYKQSRWIGSSLNYAPLKVPVFKHLFPFAMIIAAPILIPVLAIRKSYKNKDPKHFFPWMLIFMAVRFLGTAIGVFRKVYFGKNFR